MASKRPARGDRPSPGDINRGTRRAAGGDDNGETNLGAVLKAALQQKEPLAAVQEPETQEEEKEQEDRKLKRCADCWHAIVFKDERGRLMARCEKNLWMRPHYTYEELNTDKVRRWHADCPEYDDSE